jgi:hypothetical protein
MSAITMVHISSIHFVGSSGLSSADETLRKFATLPHVKRLPDGEPGKRSNFIGWQVELFQPFIALLNSRGTTHTEAATDEEVEDALQRFQSFECEYDTEALASYAKFKQLREDGLLPENVRFQVCLPTPLTVTVLCFRPEVSARVEQAYQTAMLRALRRLQDKIPAENLAIQWDAPFEFAVLEKADFATPVTKSMGVSRSEASSFWLEGTVGSIAPRLARLGEAVDDGVELGYHFCYGRHSMYAMIERLADCVNRRRLGPQALH